MISAYEIENNKKMSRNRKIAIRNYLNFLVKKGYFRKSQVIDYYPLLELGKAGGIRPANKAFTTDSKIIEAHNYLLQLGDETRLLVFYILLFSGTRLSETCDILNNFSKSELVIRGNIAYYDILSMYKRIGDVKAKAEQSKRAWVAFMPVSLAKQLKRIEVKEENLRGHHLCNGIVLPNMFRKWFSNFLERNNVKEELIEFITGKTPMKILRRHYLTLLEDSIKEYSKLVDKFPINPNSLGINSNSLGGD